MYQIRSAQVTLNVEQVDENGKLSGMQEVPVKLFETQFDQTIESLASQLLAQANSSSEAAAKGGEKKAEG